MLNRLREILPLTAGSLPHVQGNGKAALPPALPEAKAAPAEPALVYPAESFWLSGNPAHDPASQDALLRGVKAYLLADLAYAAINYRARKLSETPLYVVEESEDGEEWVRGHPIEAVLEEPNDDQGLGELIEETVLRLDCTDMALWVKDADRRGLPARLTVFGADEFTVGPADGRLYGRFRVRTAGGVERIYGPDEVVFFRHPHPTDRWRGWGPLSAAAAKLGLGQTLVEAVRNMLRRGARPGASVTTDQTLSAETRAELKDALAAQVEGVRNHGRTFVGDQGLSLQFHEHDLNKLATGELMREVEAAVCMCFGVRPEVLGALVGLENAPWSHMKEARRITYHDAIQPLRRRIESVVTRQLLRPVDPDRSRRLKFDTSQVAELQDDHESKARTSRMNSDIWTVDERRIYTGMEPLGDGRGGEIVGQRPAPQAALAQAGRTPSEAKARGLDERAVAWLIHDAATRTQESAWEIAARIELDVDRREIAALARQTLRAAQKDENAPVDPKSVQELRRRLDAEWAGSAAERWKARTAPLIEAGARAAVERVAGSLGVSFDLLQPGLLRYTEREAAWLVTEVTRTTRNAIADALSAGLAEGESIADLAARIAEAGAFAPSRAELIARTETTRVTNHGQRETLSEYQAASGNRITKSWLATKDDRVRDEHAAMDGETRGIDEPFSNGLDAPGEPNCRCTLIYSMTEAD